MNKSASLVDDDDVEDTDDNKTRHIYEKVLVPRKVVHGRAQAVLARVPQQPLQPPDGLVERFRDLVCQEAAVLSGAAYEGSASTLRRASMNLSSVSCWNSTGMSNS